MKKSHLRRAPFEIGLTRFTLIVILALACTVSFGFTPISDDEYDTNAVQGDVQFTTVDVVIDTHDVPLAAWQIEFTAPQNVQIVGIENGDFADDPPHYDPAAIQNNRVILAQYSLDDAGDLPSGEMRAATLHLRVEGELDLDELKIELTAAGDARGERLDDATTRIERNDD